MMDRCHQSGGVDMTEDAKKIAEMLKNLANENRLLILCALMQQPMTVGALAAFVPSISQSALSQHLSMLKSAGILRSEKNAQSVTYAVADERAAAVVRTLKVYYCANV